MASHLICMVEAGGSIKKDNMVMAIGAVTEAGREETW